MAAPSVPPAKPDTRLAKGKYVEDPKVQVAKVGGSYTGLPTMLTKKPTTTPTTHPMAKVSTRAI
jgi:hypothetical protein